MKFFPFASWEHPFWRSDLLQPAQLETARHIAQIEDFQRKRSWLFFRALDSSDEANFVAAPLNQSLVSGHFEPIRFPSCSPLQLKTSLDDVLQKGKFARLFFLEENENLRRYDAHSRYLLIVGAMGWASWIRLNSKLENSWFESEAPFVWTKTPDAARFLETPALELWAQIQTQKADETSDCAFARRFLDWSEEERQKRLWNWKNGSREELKAVLKIALLSQNELWENVDSLKWTIFLEKFQHTWHRGFLNRFSGSTLVQNGLAPGVLREVLRRVHPFFAPTLDEDSLQHLAAARWRNKQNPTLQIEIQNPSAHERLEAHLQWRDWQAKNL